VALGLVVGLLGLAPQPARAVGERFEAAKEEPATTYGRRFNWAHARPNDYSTTQHAHEDPRLDETQDPDGSYLGTATARLEGLPPGLYEVWLFYRRSNNRSHCAPWAVEADGDPATRREGFIDQNADEGPDGDWFPIEATQASPLAVRGSLTLVFNRDDDDYDCYDRRSVAYGGVRAIRVQDAPAPDAAMPSAPPLDAASPDAAMHDAASTAPPPSALDLGPSPEVADADPARVLPGPPPHREPDAASPTDDARDAAAYGGGCSTLRGGRPLPAHDGGALAALFLVATGLGRRRDRTPGHCPAGGCQSSSLLPSGSTTQAKRPYSESCTSGRTSTPSARSAVSTASRSSTR
jgi:hypothetical protein